jgi:hypothetical protein
MTLLETKKHVRDTYEEDHILPPHKCAKHSIEQSVETSQGISCADQAQTMDELNVKTSSLICSELAPESIRVVTILPGKSPSAMQCWLFTYHISTKSAAHGQHFFENDLCSYEALSYE